MEGDHSIAYTGHNLVLFDGNFRHHVTVDGVVFGVLENRATLSGSGVEEVVRLVFGSCTLHVNQSQVLAVKTPEERLGQSDGHFVLATV